MSPQAPNTENYTVPGGIKLFVNLGQGERDLGNIVDIDLEPGSTLLEHFTNRSGKRMKNKQVTLEDKVTLNFTLDEPNFENMRLFFRGGPTVLEGDGIAAKVDQKLILNGINLVSVGAFYGLTAVAVRQFLDYCFLKDDSADGAFVDHSVEADSLAGVSFEGIAEADDELYLGKVTKFKEVYFDVDTPGEYTGGLTWKYWNGTTWFALVVAGAGADMEADGKMTFTPPVDWEQIIINGVQGYFIQATADTIVTPATVKCIRQNAVVNTDYILDVGIATPSDRQDGRVGRLAGGFLNTDEEVKVSFTYVTWVSQKMAINAQAVIEAAVRLECFPTTGRGINWEVYFPKATIMNKGNMKLDDKAWLPVPMTLDVLDNSNVDPSYPFGWYRNYEATE